jgi:processing peptidase subunit alpha
VRQSIEFENEDMGTRLDLEPILNELIHSAAYGNQTLGNPKYCPNANVSKISSKHLYSFMKAFYKPSRTVLACVGIGRVER